MNKITVNGKTTCVAGSNIVIVNGTIVVDGKKIGGTYKASTLYIEGDAVNIATDADVYCNNVLGDIDAGGSVNCNDVGHDVDAGGSVNCNIIKGDVDAGGSINFMRMGKK